jgi:hypothetical protein
MRYQLDPRLARLAANQWGVVSARLTLEGRFIAAVKACGEGAVLSHFAAAALWGMVAWDDRYPEVTARHSARHPGIRVHRSTTLEPPDVTRRRNIAVTAPVRTLIDLSSALPYKQLRRATREAHRLKLVTITELSRRAGARRGTANLRAIVATGIPPTRSELEDAFLDLCA